VTGGADRSVRKFCERVTTFGASRLLVIENSEPALYAITEALIGAAPRPRSTAGSRISAIASG